MSIQYRFEDLCEESQEKLLNARLLWLGQDQDGDWTLEIEFTREKFPNSLHAKEGPACWFDTFEDAMENAKYLNETQRGGQLLISHAPKQSD